ncbi:hypothetical protein EV672_101265 [Aquabacterium commune]|uniref:Outer membrane scaffolding protein for murein synthesis (MipA/OmpV family) n=1 Tax=Aquabacterium commune TaxID=70586 RepID=A0A4R6RN23_9BURK|nr:hypothetical protein [Aquabacterium commune]TDP88121.1 hypothetical protein EV672_101265 [Aquabacterium commune]
MTMAMRSLWTRLLPGCWLCLAGLASAEVVPDLPPPDNIDLQLAFENATGRYGEAKSSGIRQTTLSTRYRKGNWLLGLDAPWLQIQDRAPDADHPRAEGVGDVVLRLTRTLRDLDTRGPGIDITTKVKTRTGNAGLGLGSGATDVSLQIDGTQLLSRSTLLFGHIGKRETGDLPGRKPFKDPWYAEAGFQTRWANQHDAGVYHSVRGRIGALGPLREWTAFAGTRVDAMRFQVYLSHGVSRASADWAAGMIGRYRF